MELCERKNWADTEVSEEGRRGGAQDAGADTLPLQLVLKTMHVDFMNECGLVWAL